ncbi:YhfC family glutamic-type intramembrane protease [Paenactinomyces guangxiensis]|uniref:YhfC family intramembrane metalloprotease n=1 Tax=Paenactinomyces guangxiensis TaxID=1490290 RepID=A0A7W1WND1_9BACL|nr:YhfC family glutamic-type intramembrane protease [Paenactinomyces guangxiensis]MBA4492899.1 YhfC family intramembrane metalloprotease [Paenactinomyces guangxiensis]MBH8590252.1 YhfC family intramembrane metalloprotease [Paenactinomyces guangxiensis]
MISNITIGSMVVQVVVLIVFVVSLFIYLKRRENLAYKPLWIALSLVVLHSVKERKISLLFLAIFLHTFIDLFVGLDAGGKLNFFVTEAIVKIFGVLSVISIKKSNKWFKTSNLVQL